MSLMTVSRSPVDLHSIAQFEDEVIRLRSAAFALSDCAREILGHGFTGVHVHLQTAANELGELERLLADSRR